MSQNDHVVEQLAAGFAPASRETWLKLVDKVLRGAEFDKRLVGRTADGIAVAPLYVRGDRPGIAARPVAPGAASGRWDIRQRHGLSDPKAANAAILEDLEGGVTSVVLQFAAPGQAGLPATAEAVEAVLAGVLLDACAVALSAGTQAPDLAQMLVRKWEASGIAPAFRQGAFNYDPLGVLAATGTLADPLDAALAQTAGLAASVAGMPHVTALAACGQPYHEAGASEAQELAAMLATLVAYLRACEARGIPPRQAALATAAGLAADADLFLTMAKLRAARRLIVQVADSCGAADAGRALPICAVTSERMMAARDPWVNILRTTIAAAAAAFGGASSITVLPFTWALGQPDSFARRIARNTHLVLQEESSLARVADPAGGSYYVERLTDDLARAAWTQFQDIEARGGMAAVLLDGSWQSAIGATASQRANRIATGKEALTGVSAFPLLADDGVKIVPHPTAPPLSKGAVTITPLPARRLAEPFERLRDAADAHRSRTGRSPRVFLASLGDLAAHSARTTWMRNFLAAGGIEAIGGTDILASGDAGRLFAESGASIACLCSSDATYAELAEASAGALKAAGAKHVLLAGRPRDQEAALKAAGVDGFVYAGIDAVEVLTRLQADLGVAAPG